MDSIYTIGKSRMNDKKYKSNKNVSFPSNYNNLKIVPHNTDTTNELLKIADNR